MRGRFITFEGGEGSGKSTHAKLLADRLVTQGIEVVLTREPGGSPGAEIIRHILLSGVAKPLGAETEAILFAAARDDHVRTTIAPALAAGKWVICDRFIDSTRVYQGIVGRVDHRLIRGLERVTVGDVVPDLTIILDIPADLGLARAARRRTSTKADRFEAEDMAFHELLRQAYLTLEKLEPQRCVVVDGRNARDVVAGDIWKIVAERLRPYQSRSRETVAP
ncbi:MAG TPA: dTMP kinase [Pseudolabrys sp.]|nr:dTMP kinase [Pseudolabrys sp.]